MQNRCLTARQCERDTRHQLWVLLAESACSADLGLMRPGVVPAPPSVFVLLVLRRPAVGARQVEGVLQLGSWPQDVQGVVAELLQES